MNIEALERLAAILETIEPTPTLHFNLSEWEAEMSCGTACCAVGYAMRDPWFNAAGLSRAIGRGGRAVPALDGRTDWAATEAFFDITAEEAETLFYDGSYEEGDWGDPRVVAKRIREFISSAE